MLVHDNFTCYLDVTNDIFRQKQKERGSNSIGRFCVLDRIFGCYAHPVKALEISVLWVFFLGQMGSRGAQSTKKIENK